MPDLHPAQAATDPWATGITYHRFMLDRVTRMGTAWLTALRRGTPILVDGRNVTLEAEREHAKQKWLTATV